MGTAQTRAQNKYINKVYDRVNLVVDKGEKDKIKAHAAEQGESLNGFINRAISETIERDKTKTKTE
jgi:predicted HicB family RNase H-like nuclease